MQLVATTTVDTAVRQAAAVSFKNLIKYRWVGEIGCTWEVKPACAACQVCACSSDELHCALMFV